MNFNFRKTALWASDRLRGGPLAQELHDVERMLAGTEWSMERRQSLLQRLLKHAQVSTEFYEKCETSNGLEGFPVVNKSIVRNNADAFMARGSTNTNLYRATTSGSTGIPFEVLHDKTKRRRVAAEAVHFGKLAGFETGNRLYHIKIWSERNQKSPLQKMMQNVLPIDVLHFDKEQAGRLLSTLFAERVPSAIIAYASAIHVIAQYLLDAPPSKLVAWRKMDNLKSVIAQSEALDSGAKEIIFDRLGVMPVGRYGAEELGVIAQQPVSNELTYHVNVASQIVEILRLESDTPAEPGKLGRVVVTDLFSLAQPLIRYDTGDLGIGHKLSPDHLGYLQLSEIEGRKLDQIYDVNDRPVSPFIFYKFIFRYTQIQQLQIVQTARGSYMVKLNAAPDEVLASSIRRDLSSHLGASVEVDIRFVNEIPALSSGKRQTVTSLYRPE